MTVWIIGLAHGAPSLLAGALTKSRGAVIATTAIMVGVALIYGSDQYAVFDLIGIGIGAYIGYSASS